MTKELLSGALLVMCNHVERKFYEYINVRLRLYLWERTLGEITDSAGECVSVSATNKANEYCAELKMRSFISYDLETFVKWFIVAGASNIKILSLIYDSNACRNMKIGQWLVYFEVH